MNLIKKLLKFFESPHPSQREINFGLLATRIAVAVFFITHGYDKFFGEMGLAGFAGMMTDMGMPMAGVLAFMVATAELFGGLAILLGVFTRFSAFWLAIISLMAWVMVKGMSLGMVKIMPDGMPMGGGDLDVLALGLTIAILFMGPGAMSVSGKIKHEHNS